MCVSQTALRDGGVPGEVFPLYESGRGRASLRHRGTATPRRRPGNQNPHPAGAYRKGQRSEGRRTAYPLPTCLNTRDRYPNPLKPPGPWYRRLLHVVLYNVSEM